MSKENQFPPLIQDAARRAETQLKSRGFEPVASVEALSRAEGSGYALIAHTNEIAEIAPWSSTTSTILHVKTSAPFKTRGAALQSVDELVRSVVFNDEQVKAIGESLPWVSLVEGTPLLLTPLSGSSSLEGVVVKDAPNGSWNAFIQRSIVIPADNITAQWSCSIAVHIERAVAVTRGVWDLRLLTSPASTNSAHSYTFGISLPTMPAAGSNAADNVEGTEHQIRLVRTADMLVHGTVGIIERMNFVYGPVRVGYSCALTVSRIRGEVDSGAEYTIEAAQADMTALVTAINSKLLRPGEKPVVFTKPVINLSSAADLTKDHILGILGGARVLGVRMKNFMDRATVCAKLRKLESDPDFWCPYLHEIFDAETGAKTYHFDDVWRPKVGYPFNRTYAEPPESPEWSRYFDSTRDQSKYMRSYLAPYTYPLDHYLSILDSLVDTNVHVHSKFGKKMQAGMLRLVKKGTFTPIHIDHPPDVSLGQFRNILSTNFYTARSETGEAKGGELFVYDAPLEKMKFFADLENVARDYVAVNMEPEQGDAIIICPELPHAIASVARGARLSLNVFLGVLPDSEETRIRVWN